MRPLLSLLLLSALSLATVPVSAGEVRYAPRLDESAWAVSASREECRLSQAIPWYGSAAFVRRAGEEMQFTLEVKNAAPRAASGRLQAVPPHWMHTPVALDLGQITLSRGRVPVTLGDTAARRMLAELEKGMQPTFIYRDWVDGRDQVSVALSAVNLRKTLGEFYDCLTQLLPYAYDSVQQSRIYFNTDSATLSKKGLRRLEQLARFITQDPTIEEIHLAGYADNQGYRKYNKVLAKHRVEVVQNFLRRRGVPEPLFTIDVVGETAADPLNRTAAGRAENRRTEIWLKRKPAPEEPTRTIAQTP